MKLPKVVYITTIDLSLSLLLLNHMGNLKQAGYEVIAISAPGPNVPTVKAAGIPHISVPMTRNITPLADLRALWQLYRIMRRERFTIVHGHTPKAELLGQLAARLAGMPIVVDTFRGIYFRQDMHPLWRRLFIGMARVAAACADVVLSQSRWAMEMAVEEGICPADKIKLLGNGIDVRRFDRQQLEQRALDRLRGELALPRHAPVVGFVGRLVREKGVQELLQAGRTVREQIPDVRFLFVGPLDSEKSDAVELQIAQEYGLAEACVFTGLRQDLPELYALMDLFVLPTHRESFPRSPMEASAMGVPCILSDIPGCREVVEHGRNGLLTPPSDVQALADAIIELLNDPEKAHRMGQEGRRIAHERFDEQQVFDKVKTEYARLLREKGLAGPLTQPEPGVL